MGHTTMVDKKTLGVMRKRKALTLPELSSLFGSSRRTTQRRMKQLRLLTSYNHNGRYYTLPDIPSFDVHDLWHYRNVSFSKHGNLKKTVISLVQESPRGLSAAELGEILRMNPQSFLSHFQDEPELFREKIGGRYIWFTADKRNRKKQKQGRMEKALQGHLSMPSDREAIMILVDLLHNPSAAITEIALRLKQEGLLVDPRVIHRFLTHHDLLKKTTDSSSSTA